MSDHHPITARAQTQKAPAATTARKRRATWNQFETWCAAHGYRAIPPSATVIELYVRAHTGKLAWLTLKTRVEHLRVVCHAYAVPWPEDETVITVALRRAREHGTHRGGTPLLERELTDLGRHLAGQHDGEAVHDWALIALGAAAGLDAHELAALGPQDAQFDGEGRVRLALGERRPWLGDLVVAPLSDPRRCPVAALRRWLDRRDDRLATIFCTSEGARLTPVDVTKIVRRRIGEIGRAPSAFSWLSLRAARLAAQTRLTA